MNNNQQFSNELLLEALNNCMDGIYIFKPDGKLVYCNDSVREDNGLDNDADYRNILDIFPKLLCVRNHQVTLLSQDQTDMESFAYRKNQTCYPVKTRLRWVQQDNECYGILTATNTSDLKASLKREKIVQKELENANSVKNMFLANITHELRTPVNGMKGLADLLFDTNLTMQQKDTVNIIRRCCDNMSNMINEVLDLTKMSAGKLELEKTEFDFKQFISNTIAVHMANLSQKGLKIQVNIGEDVPEKVIGDELRLGQILNNLISNAIKFTSSGRIAVEVVNTYEDDQQLELFFMVMDTGIGISKEGMDKLFINFSQVDGSITRKYGGTGLGLAISKMLVELMNGSVYVDSEVGNGSTFSFSARFPKQKNQEESNTNESLTVSADTVAKKVSQHKTIKLKLPDVLQVEKEETLDKKLLQDYEEKLMVCLELDIWEKAENYAAMIRQIIPESMEEGRKQAFRLLLAVRKENEELSIQLLSELKLLIQ